MTDDSDDDRLSLPPELRAELKEPFGPVTPDTGELLETIGEPLIAVGDVVTYHLREAGRTPDVAVVDGYTKREAVDPEVQVIIEQMKTERIEVENPPATITADLIGALQKGLDRAEPTTVVVEGEEDLAALPAIVLAPDRASVIYGQPDEGMVHVTVDPDVRERVRTLLGEFEGGDDWLWALFDGE